MLVVGMVRSLAHVSVHNRDALRELSCDPTITMSLVTDTEDDPIGLCPHHRMVVGAGAWWMSRVQRIAALRSAQRSAVRRVGFDTVVVLDLDLYVLPLGKIEEVAASAAAGGWNAVCANGVHLCGYPNGALFPKYYDTFATVVWPRTWMFGLHSDGENRGVGHLRADEDPEWVTMEVHSPHELFHKLRGASFTRARSCFGGMAVYLDAEAWLDPECGHSTPFEDEALFAGDRHGEVCEHVRFHECLHRRRPEFRMAIMGSLLSQWTFTVPTEPHWATVHDVLG